MTTKQIAPIDEFKKELSSMSGQFKMVLPAHIPVERFQRFAQTAILSSPGLLKVNRASLFSSLLKLAEMGLMPDGESAVILPYQSQAKHMPMVAGILKLIRQSGEIESFTVNAVYPEDKFRYWVDDKGEHIEHEPVENDELVDNDILKVYALARTKDGGRYVTVMSRKAIEKTRGKSMAPNSPAWKEWWKEMAEKTVIRKISKKLPKSSDQLNLAIKDLDKDYDFKPKTVTEIKERPSLEKGTPKNLLEEISKTEEVI